jgi:transcriptional regulator with PAS, ATPase and Fis domain
MARVLKTLDRITPTNLPVLVVGESGTGKELIARAIHFNSPRSAQPFVSENCAAIPATLFESELFGYVHGAFTGADQDREGLIELASGGTLFLDEIGDLDLSLQKKLLRVLQEGEIRRLGDKRVRKVDLRVVSATNRNLEQLIHEKRFREDLYFRLCGVAVHLPPLRARTEDIPPLVDHFIQRIAAEEHGPAKRVDSGALRLLMDHRWPGNVRELENELRRAWHLAESVITADDLSPAVGAARGELVDPGGSRLSLREVVDRLERRTIEDALQEFGGNKSRVARALGLSRVGLRKKMLRLGLIDPEPTA